MKKVVFKVLFLISFIPIIYSLIISIIAMFEGTYPGLCFFSCTRIYGFKAFTNEMFLYLMFFTMYGILPICIIYQIIFLIKYFKNKNRR